MKLKLFSKRGPEERKKRKGKTSPGTVLFLVGGGGELCLKLFLVKTNLVVWLTETLPDNCNIPLYVLKLCPVKPAELKLSLTKLFTLRSVGF